MEKYDLSGKVILFGTPAEEGGGGKIRLLNAGAYRDRNIDVSLMAHPGIVHDAALVSTSAYSGFTVEYTGRQAHAAASPWEGVSPSEPLIQPHLIVDLTPYRSMPWMR